MKKKQYESHVCGDAGFDNGLFYEGRYKTLEEAIKACNDGLEMCHSSPNWAEVTDENGHVVWSWN